MSTQSLSSRTSLTRESCPTRALCFEESIAGYPDRVFRGRGIVLCAGGVRMLTNAWVCIRSLRARGCRLPIEVWHLGDQELFADWKNLAEPFGVTLVDALQLRAARTHKRLGGWELKTFSLLHTSFKEVILLDADNVPLIDPEAIFEWPDYRNVGTVFWPDYSCMEESRSLWQDMQVSYRHEPEVESGQIVLDKERCWRALHVANWMNENSDFFYQFMHGDKTAFQFGWYRTNTPYAMTPYGIHSLEGTMGQHDFLGNLIFLHRNMLKWDLAENRRSKGFINEVECLGFIDELRRSWFVPSKYAPDLTAEDRQTMQAISGRRFRYHRVGHDSRPMRFAACGVVAQGAADCERVYFCRGDGLTLISGRGEVTCELKRQSDGSYYGRWLNHERMPIVLELI